MTDVTAMRIAIRLNSLPSELRAARVRPLPGGITLLLAIAAGEEDALTEGAALLDRSKDTLIASARFFVEQVMLAPDSSSYRMLGVAADAPAGDLRRHIALVLKYLHPDRDPDGDRAALALRVTGAWETLKTPDRRAAYDRLLGERDAQRQQRDGAATPSRERSSSRSGSRKSAGRTARNSASGGGFLSRLVRAFL